MHSESGNSNAHTKMGVDNSDKYFILYSQIIKTRRGYSIDTPEIPQKFPYRCKNYMKPYPILDPVRQENRVFTPLTRGPFPHLASKVPMNYPRQTARYRLLLCRHSVLDTESSRACWIPASAGMTNSWQAAGNEPMDSILLACTLSSVQRIGIRRDSPPRARSCPARQTADSRREFSLGKLRAAVVTFG